MGARITRVTRSGATGWALLVAGVLAWNASHARDGEMLSTAFARACTRRRRRTALLGFWTALTLHLFGWLPRQLDPFAWLGAGLTHAAGRRLYG
jgi:hypothetical protein